LTGSKLSPMQERPFAIQIVNCLVYCHLKGLTVGKQNSVRIHFEECLEIFRVVVSKISQHGAI